jgi:hypothetical protein
MSLLRRPGSLPGLCTTLAVLALIVSAAPASAQATGHIFTTLSDGTTVNANIFPSKGSVYLNGGPQNENSKGLPDGTYYFQVTDPAGKVLLSSDSISCRQLLVSGGIVAGATGSCPHANGSQNTNNGGSIPVQLIPFNDTPNAGGEYKVWLTNVNDYDATNCGNFGFCDNKSKTDNFKVQSAATIKVCKFNDLNGNSLQDSGEPLIPHWPVTATGVDGDTGNGVSAQTDDNGCIAFSVSTFTNNAKTVTLAETVLPGWQQTAPLDCGTLANCTVTDGVSTIVLAPGDNVHAPDFGNTCVSQACGGTGLVVTKTANAEFTRTFTWGIEKSVDNTQINTSGSATFNYTVTVTHDSGTDSGWQVTGSIKVSNSTPVDISGITVVDAVDDGGSCTVDTSGFSGTIPADNHVDLPYTCTYSSAPDPSAGTNTATAAWDDTTATGQATFAFTAPTTVVDGTITVTDTFGGTLGTASYTDTNPITFNYSHTFTDPAGTCTTHDNTATFKTDTNGTTGSDSKTVKVCVGADLKVSKTAVATFNSAITKNVDNTLVEQAGGSITFNYTVKVTTSGWTVSGGITVTNPNNWEAITANVADLLSDSGGSCVVTGGSNASIPASSSVTLPYVCTFAAVPAAGSGINTAMATWNAAAFFTPDGSASGTAGYAFTTLTVTDTYKGALGTVTIPPGLGTFTYSRTVTVAPGTCQNFDNTATIVETNQSASKTVTACNTNTGALTMGFWQNKNGQGIITGFCGGTSGVSLNTFLRQFNPFQDLSATATCSQDASYVTGIVKAAACTSSSNTCNAMLRAQMLATALDVYFSDPTLGGNRIGAFNGLGGSTPALGGVAIDLSKVCAMIDGSGGGSCSGVTEDARPEFGIAPPALGTTVALMLLYSDFLSGVNGSPVAGSTTGSTWYNNIKARQVIAKDAFDAINNQKALIAPPGTTASPSF